MPIGLDLLLVIIAFALAVASLAGKAPLVASVFVLCLERLVQLAGR